MASRSPEHSARYKRYIASPQWARKKREYFTAHGRTCHACSSTEQIHLHHKSYDNLENEPLTDLVALCEACHNLVHSLHESLGGDLRTVTDRLIADYQAAQTSPTVSLANPKNRPPRQSKRKVRFSKRIVPACLANRDRCGNPAPSGSGYCWKHDPALTTSSKSPETQAPSAYQDPISVLAERRQTQRHPGWVNGR